MHSAEVDKLNTDGILKQLNKTLQGDLSEKCGETTLTVDNEMAKGTIRSIDFDWGVAMMDYDISFAKGFTLKTKVGDITPLVFFYVSEGHLEYCCDDRGENLKLNQYQNIIINDEKYKSTSLVFPEGKRVKVNFIQIHKKMYLQKKNNNLKHLNEYLLPVVKNDNSNFVYYHLGNYSLKIADQIKKLQDDRHEQGIIRSLSLEAQLNLVLAMQLTEHQNYVDKITLPEALSIDDIKKVYRLREFIRENISEAITVKMLTEESGLSSKKLQLGFKVLYSSSVNVFIREEKLKVAEDLLKNSALSISEIVYNIGFKSRSYFSKIFSENYGILPTEYRKKLKTAVG